MTTLIRIGFILLPIFYIQSAFSQGRSKLERKAEKIFYDEDFAEALPQYQQLVASEPDNNDAKYKLELCSLLVEDYRNKSLTTILGYSSTQGRRDKFYNYWLGRAYITRYRFEEAISAWNAFLDLKAYKSQIITDETREFIEIAKHAKQWYDNPVMYKLEKLADAVNSGNSELSPAFVPGSNQLLFASRNRIDGNIKIFITTLTEGGWSLPEEFTNFGTLSNNNIDLDYLYSGKLFFKNDNKHIMVINNDRGRWTAARSYDYKLSGGKAKSHFSIGRNEDRVIYAQETYSGNLDLYETVKTAGNWSKPEFLYDVNTHFNEDSPFLSADGQSLYFSSEGHDAAGGFDVMVSRLGATGWSKPENMGYPINTIDDELHFSLNEDGKTGYLSSNRLNTNGGFDIYRFKEVTFTQIEGIVANAKNGLFIPGLRVEFHPMEFPSEIFSSLTDEVGSYKTKIISDSNFEVMIYENEDVLYQDELTLNTDQDRIRRDFRVVPREHGEGISLAEALATNENTQFNENGYSELDFIANKFRPGNKAILKNLYFKFGSTEIIEKSRDVTILLFKVLNSNPGLKVTIAGHTDNVGGSSFNLRLSEERARAVKNQLVEWGIDPNRMRPVGYGEKFPLASNDDENNGRALNRRIEVVVIE